MPNHPDYSGTSRQRRKNALRRQKSAGMTPGANPHDPPSARGQHYDTVKRPAGAEWEIRRNRVLAKALSTPCLYCGRPPQNPVVAHLVSLFEGQHLGIATSDVRHPLNAEPNLVPVCQRCNLWASTASIWTGRAKVADKLGMTRPYNGPVPDTTAVQAALDALRAKKVPAKAEPLTTNSTASDWPFPTINAAIRAFEYPAYSGQLAAEDIAEIWNHAGAMACDCGEATGDRCFICLPLPFREFVEED